MARILAGTVLIFQEPPITPPDPRSIVAMVIISTRPSKPGDGVLDTLGMAHSYRTREGEREWIWGHSGGAVDLDTVESWAHLVTVPELAADVEVRL